MIRRLFPHQILVQASPTKARNLTKLRVLAFFVVQSSPVESIEIYRLVAVTLTVSHLPPARATVMALSDTGIRKAKPGDKPQKLTDGAGLYLLLNPNGSKW